ncbi:MAG: TIGR03619 family F420-dependent LLM class oxidoreductase, partial [Dehalococcoidia bacterium]
LVIQRDPIITANEVASVDRLSGGRVLFGIGGGWNVEEIENHGVGFRSRWRVLRERVLAMKEIWAKEEAEFHGEYVDFDRIWSHPKPVQQPHPPILMGGDGPTTFDRVIEFCDGWVPILRGQENIPSLLDKVNDLRRRAEEAKRDPDSISVSIFGVRPDPETVEKLNQDGIDRIICWLPSAGRETVLPLLDQYTAMIR